jgi:hypothetical protein
MKANRRAGWALAVISILFLAGRSMAQTADPAPSPMLAYQGRLLEFNNPVAGTRNFVFSILDSTGKQLWTSGSQALAVTGGLYAVVLGSSGMPPLPDSLLLRANLSLRVSVEGVQLSPDVPVVPALQANSAWNVLGPFLGDISGTQQSISVDKLKGIAIESIQFDIVEFSSWTARETAKRHAPHSLRTISDRRRTCGRHSLYESSRTRTGSHRHKQPLFVHGRRRS